MSKKFLYLSLPLFTISLIIIYFFYQPNKGVVKTEKRDLDNNFILETYKLEKGQLTILENEELVWQSPADWWVDDFVLADSNNDGSLNINLSLWKPGNFGTSQPFWIKENDLSVKNHFFVLSYIDGQVKQVWGSSNLAVPNCAFKIIDIDKDGKNDLLVIEGQYIEGRRFKKMDCSSNYLAIWKWDVWGFSNYWRSEKGNYTNLNIEKKD